ncbi:hypothetical protein K8T06_16520, partial [bacterium]|nr:hypothetical protein [bacterium]
AAKANIGLDSICPASMAILRIASEKETSRTNVNVMLLTDNNQFEVIITRNGKFLAGRIVKVSNPWESEPFDENATDTERDDIPATILKNIQLAMLMCNRSCPLDTIEEIICVGKFDDELLNELKNRLPATLFSPFYLDRLIEKNSSYQETAAVCLAMGLLSENGDFNFLPPAMRPVRRDMGRIMIGAAAGLLAAAMILVGANSYWKTELKLVSTNAKLVTLEHRVNQIMEINQQFSESQNARNFFRSRSVDYPGHLDILLEVTRLLPAEDTETTKKVWLENYDVEDHELSIRGDSDSPEGLLTSLEESPYFEKVKFDGTVSGTRFTIKATISKLTEVEESPETETSMNDTEEDNSGQKASSLPKDTESTKTPEKQSEGDSLNGDESSEDDSELPSEQSDQHSRGPAFPKTKTREPESDGEEMKHVEPLSVEDQEQLDDQTEQADMEAMKKNLFDFIQERKAAGDIDPDKHRGYEDQDPDEAAANFLDFLRAASESGEGKN